VPDHPRLSHPLTIRERVTRRRKDIRLPSETGERDPRLPAPSLGEQIQTGRDVVRGLMKPIRRRTTGRKAARTSRA